MLRTPLWGAALALAIGIVAVLGFIPGLISAVSHVSPPASNETLAFGASSDPVSVSTANALLNVTFYSWYHANALGLGLPGLTSSNGPSVFSIFLAKDSAASGLLRLLSAAEQSRFSAANRQVAAAFVAAGNTLHGPGAVSSEITGSGGTYRVISEPTLDSMHYFIAASTIQGNDQGTWLYVSVNYYVINFYFFSVTYGENDFINALYEGTNAQNEYNQISTQTTDTAILEDAAIGVLGVALVFAAPSLGITLLVGGILAAVLFAAGLLISVLAAQANADYTQLYESTYANEPSGSKYLWMYFNIQYFYPWITLLGTLASSAGFYGYLSNGNSVTILGNYPFLDVALAPSLSGYAQSLGGTAGWNRWVSTTPLPVQLLAGYADTPAGTGWSDKLSFTVPAGISEELFVWTASDTVMPTLSLPTGLSIATETGTSTGIASGTLTAGSYSVTLSANGGWVNTVTMAVYAIAYGPQVSYQFMSASQVTSLTLDSGASAYIGVLETGGAYPLTNPSLTTIDEQTPSQAGGETDLIGQQSSDTFSFSTTAGGYGIAAVAILPAPSVSLLAGYADTPSGNGWSTSLAFTVPAGVSHEVFFWTVSDSVAPTLTLPTGLSVQSQFGTSTGVAFGALSAGSYSVTISANGGWVNTATMAVYGVSADSYYAYQFASQNHVLSLVMASGASEYLGVEMTGGAYPLTTFSLTTINEETPSQNGGETDIIGLQASPTFSLTTSAGGYGIAAVGIYGP